MPIQIALDTPYDRQQEIIDDWHDNKLLLISRRWGKTTLVSYVIKHAALTIAGFRAAYSAPTFKLMMEVFEGYRKDLEKVTARISWADKRIELINGSVIEFWSSDDKQAGRGRNYHIWVHDEAQRQKGLADFIVNSVMPTLVDFGGKLWVLGTSNGEGTEFHEFFLDCESKPDRWLVARGSIEDNPYLDKKYIKNLRIDMGPVRAAQELDSEWIPRDGVTPLVRKVLWDELYGIKENVRLRRKVMALDASVSSDLTALVGLWTEDDHYYVDIGDITLFEPDPVSGEINYAKVEEAVWNRWITGLYSTVAYDPYQLVSTMQRLKVRGVVGYEFTQNSMRVKSDGFLRQIVNESRFHHPDHPEFTEHFLNATLKTSGEYFRITKLSKNKKIDLAVATSMAAWTLKETQPVSGTEFKPVTAGSRAEPIPLPVTNTPFTNLKNHNPFGSRK